MRLAVRFTAARGYIRGLLVAGGADGLIPPAPAVPVRTIFARFWPYTRPYRRWIWVTAVLVGAIPALDTALTWMWKVLIDHVLVPRDFSAFGWIAAVYLALTVLVNLASFADNLLSTWIGERFVLSLRQKLFSHLLTLSPDFFERRRLGDVLSRLTGDVSSIETFMLTSVGDALSYTLRIAFFSAALFYLEWRLALVALLAAPVFWTLARRFARLRKAASREKRRRSGSISAAAEESLNNVALVQSYSRHEGEIDRLHAEGLGSLTAELTSARIRGLFSIIVDLLELAGGLVVIGVGTWLLSHHELSLGGLLVFVAFVTRLYSPIRGLSRLTNTMYAASASAERIIEVLDERPAVVEPPRPRPLGRARGHVRFDGVWFRYPGASRPAVGAIEFEISPGEVLALVGPSGAGKSTLAKLLPRLYDPTAGSVTLDGHDLRELPLADLRRNVAVLLQETLVFDGTVRDNIRFGRADATWDDILAAAEAADAHDFIQALPAGYDTVIGQKGRRLSGGQRQRLAIARAMVRDARLLVLDEPTTGLDAESTSRVLEPVRRLMAGRTTIVISHNLLTTRDATRIVVLDHGRVVEQGDHDSLVAGEGLYARLWAHHQLASIAREAVPVAGASAG